jgi:hypothetical protein
MPDYHIYIGRYLLSPSKRSHDLKFHCSSAWVLRSCDCSLTLRIGLFQSRFDELAKDFDFLTGYHQLHLFVVSDRELRLVSTT